MVALCVITGEAVWAIPVKYVSRRNGSAYFHRRR
jgi:hypothetical protein